MDAEPDGAGLVTLHAVSAELRTEWEEDGQSVTLLRHSVFQCSVSPSVKLHSFNNVIYIEINPTPTYIPDQHIQTILEQLVLSTLNKC